MDKADGDQPDVDPMREQGRLGWSTLPTMGTAPSLIVHFLRERLAATSTWSRTFG